MKDSRFIELLNLYIDRQITAAETSELENEIQRDPRRQAVYRQYCRIHSATKMVYDTFRANAAEQSAPQTERAGVIELFETKRRRSHFVYYAGGLAAAACVAFALVRFNAGTSATTEPVLARVSAPAPVVATVSAPARPVVPAVIAPNRPTVNLLSLQNNATSTPDYTAMIAALREQDEQASFSSARVQSLFEDSVFESPRIAPAQDQRVFRSRQTSAQQAESTAFQFQR